MFAGRAMMDMGTPLAHPTQEDIRERCALGVSCGCTHMRELIRMKHRWESTDVLLQTQIVDVLMPELNKIGILCSQRAADTKTTALTKYTVVALPAMPTCISLVGHNQRRRSI
jgi:hypothetical protein